MSNLANRLAAALAAVLATVLWTDGATASAAIHEDGRPLSVNDIVRLEAFGRADISPDGRWAVYEKRGAYDTSARFDLAGRSTWTIMDLWAVDLADPGGAPARLLPDEEPGLQRLVWSPSGDRLLITRLKGATYEYGIVDMRARRVRWTGLAAEINTRGAVAVWPSDAALLLMARADGGDLPAAMRQDGGAQPRIAEAWSRTAEGLWPSRTVVDAWEGVETTEAPMGARLLVRLDLETGAQRVLAEGFLTDFAASPDGRTLALVRGVEPASVARDHVLQLESARRERLSLIDLETGRLTQPIPQLDVAPHLLRWSPDSGEVLVWARRDGARWSEGDLVRVSLAGGMAVDLGGASPGDDEDVTWGVKADWIGDDPVLFSQDRQEGRADWRLLRSGEPPRRLTASLATPPARIANAGSDAIHVFADGGYWSMDATGLHRLTPADVVLREAVAYDPERHRRQATNEAARRDWAVAVNASGETLLLTGEGPAGRLGPIDAPPARILATAPAGVLVLERSGLAEMLKFRAGDAERRLDVVNASLAAVRLIAPKPVVHPGADGRTVTSWLFLPENPGPARGLVIKVYPGSLDDLVWSDPLTLTYGVRSQVLAAAGFAVLSPSMPSGTAATRGDLYVRSVDLAVDAALAAYPELPGERMAVFGHSFGGYAALEIAARSTRYKSYIASSSVSDMFAAWGEFEPSNRIQPEDGMRLRLNQGGVENGQVGMEAPPWAADMAYAASSPYLKADQIRSPVLLLTADMDFVPMTQAERMFSALHRLGGTVRMVTYWGENHHVWSPANIRDRYGQIFDWLDETLAAPEGLTSLYPDAVPTTAPIPRKSRRP